ncbi:MAG: hypothetical protein LKI25_08470 [Atopobiaceae bacterium]|jgi:pilus assembly protein CpaE|nr:hypothetical protein [Atopobiaceae bacterium]MCI2174221.1 hypothetical protein [Atopobiaceae bacterium]MCI2206862.1 hypothetical protein [Atopobiaceae bacterium]
MTDHIWLACATGDVSDIERTVLESDPDAEVRCFTDPFTLRRSLLDTMPGAASAVVCDMGDDLPSAVNIAAALVSDGHAERVVLAVHAPSGSLRSRARRAGIASVWDRDESTKAVRAGESRCGRGALAGNASARAAEGSDACADDLDEPDGLACRADVPRAAPALCPLKGEHGPIVTLVSGRGGVGRTAIAAVAAYVASGWGMSVALVDLDLSFGNVAGYLGVGNPADLASVASCGGDVSSAVVASCGRRVADSLALWGPCALPELAETVQPYVAEMLFELSRTHGLVIVDTSSAWGDSCAQAVQVCDRLLVCADERAGAIASVARAAALSVRLGVARTRIVRLMNRCDPKHRDEGFLARADLGLETARTVRVMDGGDEVAELLSAGHADELAASTGEFPTSVAAMLAKVLSELGCLPDTEDAKACLDGSRRPRRRRLLSREAG